MDAGTPTPAPDNSTSTGTSLTTESLSQSDAFPSFRRKEKIQARPGMPSFRKESLTPEIKEESLLSPGQLKCWSLTTASPMPKAHFLKSLSLTITNLIKQSIQRNALPKSTSVFPHCHQRRNRDRNNRVRIPAPLEFQIVHLHLSGDQSVCF